MAKPKKKLLYVVEAMGGGIFTYMVGLANHLVEEYEITIAYSTRIQTPFNYRDYFDKRITMIEVKNFCRSLNPVNDFGAIIELKQIASKVKPDIIHLHSSKAGALGRIAFNGKTIPVFYTPHGYSFFAKNYSFPKRLLFQMIERVCAKRHCTTISCSEGEHRETLKLTKNAVCVNNAVDTAELDQIIERAQRKEHIFTVFTLGRICKQKNPHLFNCIAEMLPDINFLWIGDGELKHELIAPNIRVTGWLERGKALETAVNADAFLLGSFWEGLPIGLLEAMYLEKPCVVSNTIGNRDVINAQNGYVCENEKEFAEAIREIQVGKANDYIKRAKADVLDFYNTKVQAESYKCVYEKAIIKVTGCK